MATRRIKPRTPDPKRGQSSEEYWREREARQRAENIRNEAKTAEKINRIFATVQDDIQQEIDSFYHRYAKDEGIDLIEARRRVSQLDIKKYERLAQQYVKAAHEGAADVAFSEEANEQMRLYNTTMRINRLEMLKARCGIRAMNGYSEAEKLINDELEERAYSEYERLSGILGNSVQFNENLVRSIVNASYQNATWSDRLWNNQSLLSEQIGAQLAQGILTGKNSMVLARNIQKLTGGSAYACQRLMRTELRRVQTAAAEQSMRDNGVKKYKFLVENGVNPCDDCLDLDGTVYSLDEMAIGKNAPPLHPNCHCATAPAFDEDKWQAWLDGPAQAGVPWEEFEDDGAPSGSEAYRSWRSQTDGKLRSARKLEEACRNIHNELSKYANRESKWSGKVDVVSRLEGKASGIKRWDCHISALSTTRDDTLWHEMLHSSSSSYHGKEGYLKYGKIEEASVELLTREICREKGISYFKSYEQYVEILDYLCKYLNYDKMTFAKELYNQDLPKRLDWLENKVRVKLNQDNASFKDKNAVIAFVRKLDGGRDV